MLYVILCVLLAAVCVLAARKKKNAKLLRVLLSLAAILCLLAAAMFAWLSVYYRADNTAKAYLTGGDTVTVSHTGNIWRFDGPGEETALIFYPGAKVEATAYAPLLFRLAEGGMDAFLIEMPFHIAFFDANAADRVIAQYDYTGWVLAGHSLGGVVAARYASTHTEAVRGLVLLASYPTEKLDAPLALLSVYGDRDGVLNRERYEQSRSYWPTGAVEEIITGGNHAQFGDYGAQRGDGEALISSQAQQEATVSAILSWLASLVRTGETAA